MNSPWETYTPRGTSRLKPGSASLAKDGNLTIVDADLERGSILGRRVAVDMDHTGRRLRLRNPQTPTEPSLALSVANSQRTRTSKLNVARVLKTMGVTLDQAMRVRVDEAPGGDGIIVILPAAPRRATPITPTRSTTP